MTATEYRLLALLRTIRERVAEIGRLLTAAERDAVASLWLDIPPLIDDAVRATDNDNNVGVDGRGDGVHNVGMASAEGPSQGEPTMRVTGRSGRVLQKTVSAALSSVLPIEEFITTCGHGQYATDLGWCLTSRDGGSEFGITFTCPMLLRPVGSA